MSALGRRAATIAVISVLGAGAVVGTAGAATNHSSRANGGATRSAPATATSKAGRASTARAAKSRSDERESKAMVLRERRGPGGPREERGESATMRQMELRRHAEVKTATAGHRTGTGAHHNAGAAKSKAGTSRSGG